MNSVVSWFADHSVSISPLKFNTSTHTALQAAQNLNCHIDQIAKSVLFITATKKPILVIASGGNRVDESKLAKTVGDSVRKADKHEVKSITGYEIGGVPPVAHLQPITTFIDSRLLDFEIVYASAGSPSTIFAVSPKILSDLAQSQILS